MSEFKLLKTPFKAPFDVVWTSVPREPPLFLYNLAVTLELGVLTGFMLKDILFDPIHPGVTEIIGLYEVAFVKFTLIVLVKPVEDEHPSDNSTTYWPRGKSWK